MRSTNRHHRHHPQHVLFVCRVIGKKYKLPTKQRPDETIQETRLKGLPAEGRPLPHRPVPEAVPLQCPDNGALLQELPPPEDPVEDSVGEGAEGDWER